MSGEVISYTCGNCHVTASWMPEFQQPGLPAHWAQIGDEFFCLSCRRQRAGDAGVEATEESASPEDRVKAHKSARIDFELNRDDTRANGVIARACGTSPAVIARARERLEAETGVQSPA